MDKKRVLILGATGMAGHLVYSYLESTNKYEIINAVYRNALNSDSLIVDVKKEEDLKQLIKNSNPEVIINCIGVLINGSNDNPANAIYINAYLPHMLSSLAMEAGAKLIHISTDCVFSGKKGGYTETDLRDADDVYGRSKALGELNNERDLTIRTSIIGPEIKMNGEGLFHWFMSQNGEINGYLKAYWGGVTTLELAKAIDNVINQNLTGLINFTNGEKISKYDLLRLLKKHFKLNNLKIKPFDGKKVDKSLKSDRDDFDFEASSYENMILDMYNYMHGRRNFYIKNYTLLD